MVGEAFDEHSEDICGAVVNVRAKVDKIAVWTGNGQNSVTVLEIGYVQHPQCCPVTLNCCLLCEPKLVFVSDFSIFVCCLLLLFIYYFTGDG